MSKAIIICGDRYWTDERIIYLYMDSLLPDVRIITGGANGADKMAEDLRQRLGLDGKVYNAKWHIFKKAAGPIRNRRMIEDENPYLVVGFHDNITRSRGTRDMLLQAKRKRIRYQLRKSDGSVEDSPRL